MTLPPYPIPAGAVTPCMEDPEAYFPDRHSPARTERAKRGCARCPYRDGCLAWALTRGEAGVWGQTDEEERKDMCRAQGIVPVRPVLDLPRGSNNMVLHGTPVGVESHRRRYQALCTDCLQFDQGRHAEAEREECDDCGRKLMPASMRKHKRLYCHGWQEAS
jgi:WhiB family redox-sensing transcriptional regulator